MLSDLIEFSKTHPLLPFGESQAELLLKDLTPNADNRVDLHVDGKRTLVGTLLEICDNAANTAELAFLGYDSERKIPPRELEQIFRKAEQRVKQSPRDGLDVMWEAGYPFTAEWLLKRGYEEAETSAWMERKGPAPEAPALPDGWAWRDVAKSSTRALFELTKDAFAGQTDVNFPPFETYEQAALAAEPKARLLFAEKEVVAFVKVKKMGGDRGEILTVGRVTSRRGERLGDRAIAEGMRLLESLGTKTFFLSVSGHNHTAIKAYERQGFAVKNRLKLFRWYVGCTPKR